METKNQRQIKMIAAYITAVVVVILLIFPPLWMIMTAFKAGKDVFSIPPVLFFKPTLDNFIEVLSRPGIIEVLKNTLLVTAIATVMTQLFGTMAAYSIARFKTGGKPAMYSTLLLRVMPPVVLGLPMFILFNKLGLYDTLTGLSLAYIAFLLPNTIWLMIPFFSDIPYEIEEAAMVDGCSQMGIFLNVALPMAKSGVIVTGIYNVMGAWNHFFYGLILSSSRAKVLSIEASEFVGEYVVRWGEVSAIGTLLILPPIIVVFIMQNYLESGLRLGGVKG